MYYSVNIKAVLGLILSASILGAKFSQKRLCVHSFSDTDYTCGNCNTKRFVGWRFPWVSHPLPGQPGEAVWNEEYTFGPPGMSTAETANLLSKEVFRIKQGRLKVFTDS